MTKQELAQKFKAKYPDYADMEDEKLADQIIKEYPVYESQIDKKSTLRKVGDFFTSSTQKFAKTIGTSIATGSARGEFANQIKVDDKANQLALQISKMKKNGQNTERAEQQYKMITGSDLFKDGLGRVGKYKPSEIYGETADKTTKQVIGEGLGTGLELLGFSNIGPAAKGAKTLLTGGKTIGKAALQGSAIGGGFGAGFGVSEALQNNESMGNVALSGLKSGAIGATGGAVLGGGFASAGIGASALLSRAFKLSVAGKKSLGNFAEKKLLKTSKDLLKMSPTASKNEAKWNKNTAQFIADEFVLGEKGKPVSILQLISDDGKRIVTDNASDALRTQYYQESASFNNLLADSGEYVSLNTLRNRAIENVSHLKTRGTAYNDAIKQINKETSAYKQNYRQNGLVDGDDILVRVDDFNKIKSGLWSNTSNFNPTVGDKLLSDVNYKMGQTAKELIEETVQDTAVKRMNQRLGDFASALKALENANGKVLPGGFFGKQFTRLAGTVAGSSGGIPGSIIGNLTGGALADLWNNKSIQRAVFYKLRTALSKTTKGQNIIDEAVEILIKRNQERAARKLLNAPSFIPAGSKADTSRLFTQEEANLVLEAMKIKPSPKLLNAPLGDKTNPIMLGEPLKGKGVNLTTKLKSKVKEVSLSGKQREFAKGLDNSNKLVEADAFRQIDKEGAKILADNNKMYGKIVNTDNFRPAFKKSGYIGSNAAAVQEPASELSKIAYLNGLQNKGKYATIFAGGSGTGKTSAVKSLPNLSKILDESSVVLDGNLSKYSSAVKRIEEAVAAGKKTPIIYTYREPVDSMINGVVSRMKNNPIEMGRIVPTKITAENHIGSWKVIQRLNSETNGDLVYLIDNSLGKGNQKITTFAELSKKINYGSVEDLTNKFNKEIKKIYDEGKITKTQYQEYIK